MELVMEEYEVGDLVRVMRFDGDPCNVQGIVLSFEKGNMVSVLLNNGWAGGAVVRYMKSELRLFVKAKKRIDNEM